MQFRCTITLIQPLVADAGSVADCNATKKKPVQPADPLNWFKHEENKEGSMNKHSDAGVSVCLTKSL